jgi:glycerol-3-phosphate dehydrogenase (NAD(P)+)
MFPAADNGHPINLVGTHLDTDIIARLKLDHHHPRLRRMVPPNIRPFYHTEIAEAMRDAEIVGIGVNSRGVHWAAEAIGPHLKPGQIVLMVTKGLESADGELQILPDVLRSRLPAGIRDQVHYAAIGGPSIAGELAARRHTNVVFTSRTAEILPALQSIFATPYYHIWTTTDLIGVEVCVALKNPYALAVGLAAGMVEAENPPDVAGAKMHNYAAAVFAQGLAETAYLVQLLGGSMETVFSLPGAGDLYVTTQGGRNSRMGRLLGMGKSYSDAVEEMPNETIEGVDAVISVAPAIEQMVSSGKIAADALPLLRSLHRIVTRNERVSFDFGGFFSRLPFAPPVRTTDTTTAQDE